MAKMNIPLFLLRLSLGLMFTVLGILGISEATTGVGGFMNEINRAFGGQNGVLALVVSILQLAAGVILILSLFNFLAPSLLKILLLVVLILFAVDLVFRYFLGGRLLEPNFLGWLGALSPNLVILASLWLVYDLKD